MSDLKINKITFSNFKGFKGQVEIDLKGKNALIYGENGSGKSSLYWGLYTLLKSSQKESSEINKYFAPSNSECLIYKDIHFDIAKSNPALSYVKIEFNNNDEYKIGFNTSTDQKSLSIIQDAFYASDFVNYKLLMKIHDFNHPDEIDLFDWFNNYVLPYFNSKQSWTEKFKFLSKETLSRYFECYTDINSEIISLREKILSNLLSKYDIALKIEILTLKIDILSIYKKLTQLNHQDIFDLKKIDEQIKQKNNTIYLNNHNDVTETEINDFISTLEDLEIQIFDIHQEVLTIKENLHNSINNFNSYLKSLDTNIQKNYFELTSEHIKVALDIKSDDNSFFPKILLQVKRINEAKEIEVKKPQTFFNEARLTAIALSIRFAILKERLQENIHSPLKLLIIDDLLISLDMSHRMQVADLIIKEFGEYYQIILTTHDKIFFNMIKDHEEFKKFPITSMELYKDEDNSTFIKESTKEPMVTIDKLFKNNELEHSSNLVRQHLESICKKYLSIPEEKNKLNTLLENVKKQIIYQFSYKLLNTENNIKNNSLEFLRQDANKILNLITEIQRARNVILNSASHDSQELFFRNEVNKIIKNTKFFDSLLNKYSKDNTNIFQIDELLNKLNTNKGTHTVINLSDEVQMQDEPKEKTQPIFDYTRDVQKKLLDVKNSIDLNNILKLVSEKHAFMTFNWIKFLPNIESKNIREKMNAESEQILFKQIFIESLDSWENRQNTDNLKHGVEKEKRAWGKLVIALYESKHLDDDSILRDFYYENILEKGQFGDPILKQFPKNDDIPF